MNKQELNDKFMTIEGQNALKNRMGTFMKLFNKNEFPTKELIMLGFGKFKIETKEECKDRIKELGEILGIRWKIRSIRKKDQTGKEINTEEAIWEL